MSDRTQKHKKNLGFSMVELIVVIAIIAILASTLAVTLIKQIQLSRRTKDVSVASDIKDAFDRVAADTETTDLIDALNNAPSVTIDSTYTITNPPNDIVDAAFIDLNNVPVSSTNKNYSWKIVFDYNDFHVKEIFLIDSSDTSVNYELYPNDSAFLEMND